MHCSDCITCCFSSETDIEDTVLVSQDTLTEIASSP